ncbi:MAG: L,D-transpeptidase family protein, partial [Myxococcota bacterium]|nr:L,D-transpeptidase family protein [Myxococcota bacterium]
WSSQSKRRIYPRSTPLMSDHIDRVVVNPSWTVPPRIYRLEYKPRIDRDPTYLERNGFRLTQGDFGHHILVQPPGPQNSLGEVKVLFPNAEGIYIHDTNQRDLFRYARRAFSHGCVRVDKAIAFATDLMKVDRERVNKRWHKRTLERFSEDDETRTYVLHERIPVFLEYYTASVSRSGTVYFHPDIYDYDGRTFTKVLGKRGADTAQR